MLAASIGGQPLRQGRGCAHTIARRTAWLTRVPGISPRSRARSERESTIGLRTEGEGRIRPGRSARGRHRTGHLGGRRRHRGQRAVVLRIRRTEVLRQRRPAHHEHPLRRADVPYAPRPDRRRRDRTRRTLERGWRGCVRRRARRRSGTAIASELTRRGFDVRKHPKKALQGLELANLCNRVRPAGCPAGVVAARCRRTLSSP